MKNFKVSLQLALMIHTDLQGKLKDNLQEIRR